jgi:hypothetical protein
MSFRVLERVTSRTTLGIRFWDAAAARPVSDGLVVTAQLLDASQAVRVGRLNLARRTPSGVYAFFNLHPEEHAITEPISTHRAVLDVQDPHGRFLPVSFLAEIPFQGAFRGRGAWLARPLLLPVPNASEEQGVGLWSAPGRLAPAGMTILYAQVVLGNAKDNPPPAPFALMKATDTNNHLLGYGMADERGTLCLPLPYPALPADADPTQSLASQTFTIRLEIAFRLGDQARLPGSATPDLAALLGQPPAQIASARDPLSAALTLGSALSISLPFGRDMIVRTVDGSPLGEPYLRIQPPA